MSKPLTDDHKADIVRLYALYKNKTKVARAVNVSHATVFRVLRECGLIRRCVECDATTRPQCWRCDRCQLIRLRTKQRWWMRDKLRVRPENYRLENL